MVVPPHSSLLSASILETHRPKIVGELAPTPKGEQHALTLPESVMRKSGSAFLLGDCSCGDRSISPEPSVLVS